MALPPTFTIDIEPTNRCNASCSFCPRDATPHQGLMTMEVFDRALERAVEFRGDAAARFDRETQISLCGLGEPLLNRNTPLFVRRVREEGFRCSVSSNAALLDEGRGAALLEAGLDEIDINVSERGEEYERIYKLSWERTLQNIIRFASEAENTCTVRIILVDHRGDRTHLEEMKEFWRSHGLENFFSFSLINRGGALFVDHMQFEALPQSVAARQMFRERVTTPLCWIPFASLFIGYDGKYYLCCSDWKKEVPLGSVFTTSLLSVTEPKLHHVASREPICKTCNWDPYNRLTDNLRAAEAGEASVVSSEWLADDIARESSDTSELLESIQRGITETPVPAAVAHRKRLIPVRSE